MSTLDSKQEATNLASSISNRMKTVALAGVPNAGKTSLFNALTGMHYKVANYPGVTVEKREGVCEIPELGRVRLIDLPGAYSLFGGSPDELLAAKFLAGVLEEENAPDLVICVCDACNLQRNLYLASQLLDSGTPLILVLTMTDIAKKKGILVHKELLSRVLGVPVLDLSGRKKENLNELKDGIHLLVGSLGNPKKHYTWCKDEAFKLAAEKLGSQYVHTLNPAFHEADPITPGIALLSGARKSSKPKIQQAVSEAREVLDKKGIDASSYETEKRYQWIAHVVEHAVSFSEPTEQRWGRRVDYIATHRVWGSVLFLSIMTLMFHSVFAWAELPMELIDGFFAGARSLILSSLPDTAIRSLIADGIIAGAGSVLVFIPQIAFLYFFISILEESGYLSRAAFLMDKIMRSFGLQGRSFIPLLSCFACAVPGIMSTRSIPSWTDRMATIMVAPLMSCSARLPVYTLLIAAFIPAITVGHIFSLQGLILMAMYLLGIFVATIAAFIMKRTAFRGSPTHFVMEMPPYRFPLLKNVLRCVWERIWLFVKTAGTIILACSMLIWFLASYPKAENLSSAEALKQSYAGQMGQAIEPVIRPLGFDWKIGISIVTSFAAREIFVSSMAVVHNLEEQDEPSDSLVEAIRNSKDPKTGKPLYSSVTAISLMVFYAFACQCMSTLAVCKRETGEWKWPGIMFLYLTVLAYVSSFIAYQVGTWLIG